MITKDDKAHCFVVTAVQVIDVLCIISVIQYVHNNNTVYYVALFLPQNVVGVVDSHFRLPPP